MRIKIAGYIVLLFVLAGCAGWFAHAYFAPMNANQVNGRNNPQEILPEPEMSAWLAYWKEPEGYALIEKEYAHLHTISPVWFKLNSAFDLEEVGVFNKQNVITNLTQKHLRVVPTVSSDLVGTQLSPFLYDDTLMQAFIAKLAQRVALLGAAGIDVDLEQISVDDIVQFNHFLDLLATSFHRYHLTLIVSAHAQTGSDDDWDGAKGEDLSHIGSVADEVRIMAYDFHGPNSLAGAITPGGWLEQVVRYALSKVPKDKLVLGLPAYGYLWEGASVNPEALQFDEFTKKVALDSRFTSRRDPESQELVYTYETQSGWVSDHTAVKAKITQVQRLGLNRFVLWNVGGMDEKLFHQ